MSRVSFRPATEEDARAIARRLRPEDALELYLSSGPNIEQTLLDSVGLSDECFAAEADGAVIALGGVGFIADFAIPWLVCTPEALRFPKLMVEEARKAIARWDKRGAVRMFNFSHADNTVHHRWLEHLGFTFDPHPHLRGELQTPFRHFYRDTPQCVM